MSIQITKRDGTKQPLDIEKIHKVVTFACEELTGVSVSEIELNAQIQFQNGMKSSDIQETLIKSAAQLISEDAPNYQHVAGRLVNYHIRKEVYGSYVPTDLYTHVRRIVKKGLYDKDLLKLYTEAEYKQLDKMIDHSRDEHLTYVAMEQFRGKYLVKNRVSGKIYETPQMAYILIAAVLFAAYPADTRMSWIKKCYDAISNQEISLATPVLAGIRTPERQFSSCVLLEAGDSRDSINAVNNTIVEYVSARAGIGIHGGHIRAVNSPVQGGAKTHTGIYPWWRGFQSSVRCASQGGIRTGAATMNFFFFHLEWEDLIVLKNNKGIEDNRLRHMDYCVALNRLFYQRYLNDEEITLFSPSDIPEVVDAFYRDTDEFIRLYEIAEANPRLRKKKLSAKVMFEQLVEERFNTGRIYIFNVDHVNEHGSFIPAKAPLKMTNLCVEITLPTDALSLKDPTAGDIGVCILAGLNLGVIKSDEQMHYLAELAVRMLNLLIDYQTYPVIRAEMSTKNRRSIGVGVIGLAYWMAKNGIKYSEPDYDKIDELFESFSYGVIRGSTVVAEEFGKCPGYEDTKWSQGILPIDTYKREIDKLTTRQLTQDWDNVRWRMDTFGMANSTTMAGFPSETSSQVANQPSGLDPIRAIVTSKQSKDGALSQVAPESRRLKNKYEKLWDMPHTRGVLEVNAIAQKYFDQSISTNTSYNPTNYPDNQVPQSELIFDILRAYQLGLKTLYYNNVNDLAGEIDTTQPTEENCEACVL